MLYAINYFRGLNTHFYRFKYFYIRLCALIAIVFWSLSLLTLQTEFFLMGTIGGSFINYRIYMVLSGYVMRAVMSINSETKKVKAKMEKSKV